MLDVLFVDNHILLLNKPAGILTQPNEIDSFSLEAMGKKWLKEKFQKPGNVFLIAAHRLDRPVSGIVLLARTSKAASRLNESNRNLLFQKEYTAVVEGVFDEKKGVLEHYLQKDSFFTRVVPEKTLHAKKCVLKYTVIRRLGAYSLLKITLITGRYHQIRAQLAAINHPILGDRKYGSKYYSEHLFLHHSKFGFPHPITQNRLSYEVPIPANWNLFFSQFN